jgi:muramidase (phage lysozyme)
MFVMNMRTVLIGLLLAASTVLGTGCFPTGPVEEWVPDYNRNGKIETPEIEWHKQDLINRFVAAVENHRRSVQSHPFLTCVRHHESDRGAYPHINGYGAQNPYSTASGAYQFVNGTWRNVSARAGHGGYPTAAHAPWYVQDAVALWLYNNGGKSAWNGTGC